MYEFSSHAVTAFARRPISDPAAAFTSSVASKLKFLLCRFLPVAELKLSRCEFLVTTVTTIQYLTFLHLCLKAESHVATCTSFDGRYDYR